MPSNPRYCDEHSVDNCSNFEEIYIYKEDVIGSYPSVTKIKVEGNLFLSKAFTQEAIVQISRSLGTKSLNKDRIFSLRGWSVAFDNTDLKPLNNYLQHIKHQFCGVIMYKAF